LSERRTERDGNSEEVVKTLRRCLLWRKAVVYYVIKAERRNRVGLIMLVEMIHSGTGRQTEENQKKF
jgi:hypothetical protein